MLTASKSGAWEVSWSQMEKHAIPMGEGCLVYSSVCLSDATSSFPLTIYQANFKVSIFGGSDFVRT